MTFRHIFISSLLALSALGASAVPAKPGLLTMTQDDGSEVQVRLVGDEYSHYYLTEDGYLLTTSGNNFYYADVDAAGEMMSSGIQATPASMRPETARSFLAGVDMERVHELMTLRRGKALAARQSATVALPMRAVGASSDEDAGSLPAPVPGLLPGADFPVTGEQKALVILVNYLDVKMSTPDVHAYFSGLLNEPGFSDRGATGSARDYFEECSEGKFLPEFDVYGPVDLPLNRAHYGGNDRVGNDEHAWQMVTHACTLLDDEVDFSQYDRNGDGYIDNVFVFYAGRGEASGGGDNTVWPHSWEIENGGMGTYQFDGVTVNRYACSNELIGGSPDGVGTFIHEFSHVMGLPDLYATNMSSSFTPGSWSVLDSGPYNNNSRTPPYYSAFERCALGWMTPREITGPLSASLETIGENVAGIIRTSYENEYFLLENRQKKGWDKYIPGHGMLVWHIHYVPSIWWANAVNNTLNHQYVDLEEADGVKNEMTRSGDSFPGSAGVTSFTNETTPSMGTWIGDRLELPITDIDETADGLITFNVAGGAASSFPATELMEPAEVAHDSFRISWKPVEGARYAVSLYEKGSDFPMPDYDRVLAGTATSYEFTGLTPETEYYCRVYAGNDWQFGSASEPVYVTTRPVTLDLLRVRALPPTDVTPTSFTASWEALPGATDHLLTVFSLTDPEILTVGCDFTDRMLPDGWKLSFEPTFSPNENYCGNEFPALCFTKDGQTLTSPVFSLPVSVLSFWHVATKVDETNSIVLHALVDDVWVKVGEFGLNKSTGGARVRFDDFPEGSMAIKFEFKRGTSYGQLFIDDIQVDCHTPYQRIYLDGFSRRPVGGETSCSVEGLTPGKTYYYTVDATDGTYEAQTSREMAVTLPHESGISDVTTGRGISVTANHGTVEVTGLTAGDTVTVTDLLGRTVASTRATSGTVILPVSPGVFIVKAGAHVAKIMTR